MLPHHARRLAALKLLLILALIAIVGLEGYYIFRLRYIIDRQSEELNYTTLQIQDLRHTRSSLEEELQKIKKTSGEENDGNTSQRQH